MITDEHGASASDATSPAARLLEIAARNADELLGEAKTEAAAIVATAQAEVERVHAELDEARAVRTLSSSGSARPCWPT